VSQKQAKFPDTVKVIVQFELVETEEQLDGCTRLCYRANNPEDEKNPLKVDVRISSTISSYEAIAGLMSNVARRELISSAAAFLSTQVEQ
jgi:hypothetical protein